MKNKTIKIIGLGVIVLFVLMAFIPAVNARVSTGLDRLKSRRDWILNRLAEISQEISDLQAQWDALSWWEKLWSDIPDQIAALYEEWNRLWDELMDLYDEICMEESEVAISLEMRQVISI